MLLKYISSYDSVLLTSFCWSLPKMLLNLNKNTGFSGKNLSGTVCQLIPNSISAAPSRFRKRGNDAIKPDPSLILWRAVQAVVTSSVDIRDMKSSFKILYCLTCFSAFKEAFWRFAKRVSKNLFMFCFPIIAAFSVASIAHFDTRPNTV